MRILIAHKSRAIHMAIPASKAAQMVEGRVQCDLYIQLSCPSHEACYVRLYRTRMHGLHHIKHVQDTQYDA